MLLIPNSLSVTKCSRPRTRCQQHLWSQVVKVAGAAAVRRLSKGSSLRKAAVPGSAVSALRRRTAAPKQLCSVITPLCCAIFGYMFECNMLCFVILCHIIRIHSAIGCAITPGNVAQHVRLCYVVLCILLDRPNGR